MKKIFSVAVMGCGNRGNNCFIAGMVKKGDEFKIVALCDTNKQQIDKVHKLYGLHDTEDFYDAEMFLERKRADFLIIATPDRYHVPQCIRAMKLGYDILMEKPISDDREELELLLKTQEQTGRKVMICHELRYGAGFAKCAQLLKDGVIGKLYAIDASERAVYWHWVQAYVRAVPEEVDLSTGYPAIFAKCSHDLDLIQFYANAECHSVSSVGSTDFFTLENKPLGAAEKCVDCKLIDSCPYSAKRIYVDAWLEAGKPEFCWPYSKVCIDPPLTKEKIMEGIQNGPLGNCVFNKKSNYFVDNQFVQMCFNNGVKASLKMVYGGEPGRRIVFYGGYGEIILDERTMSIEIMVFGKKKETISIHTLTEDGNAHGGGDGALMAELYPVLSGKKAAKTTLKESIESHLMGIAAEESRRNGGILVKVHR